VRAGDTSALRSNITHPTKRLFGPLFLFALALVFRLRRLLMAGLLAGIIVRGRRGRTRLMLGWRRGTRCGLLHIRSRLILRRTRVGRPRRNRGRRRCRAWDFARGTRRGGFRSGIRLCRTRVRRHVGPSSFTVGCMRICCLRLRRTRRGGFRSGIRLRWTRVRRHVGPSDFTVRSMRICCLRLRRPRRGGSRSGIRLCWMRVRRHVGPSGFTVRSMRIRGLRLRRTGRGDIRLRTRLCWMRIRRHVGPGRFTVRSMRIRGLRLRRTGYGTAHRRRRCGIC
jgi:hypothetical protein